jgi:hypothetical protein
MEEGKWLVKITVGTTAEVLANFGNVERKVIRLILILPFNSRGVKLMPLLVQCLRPQ